MSYNEQLKQLEQIVSEIESGQLSIDQLAAKVKTATKLLADCRKQLTKVESEVNKILKPQEWKKGIKYAIFVDFSVE